MSDLAHVVAELGRPWAILPETMDMISDLVRLRASGGALSDVEISDRLAAAQRSNGARSGNRMTGAIAVLPLYGVIMPKAGLMTAVSGATSIEQFRASFREALADDQVGSILIDVDSPGGRISQVPEMAAEIRAARGRKPIVAIANTLMASAAYWIASQADEIVASPSADVGSIGVLVSHTEYSRLEDKAGITSTIIRRPSNKAAVNDIEPLTPEARGDIQEMVDEAYAEFTATVAAGRGVPVATVRSGYGQGRVLSANRAKAAGMVDRVETFDETVRRMALRSSMGGRQAFVPGSSGTRAAEAAVALARAKAGMPPRSVPHGTSTQAEADRALARAKAALR